MNHKNLILLLSFLTGILFKTFAQYGELDSNFYPSMNINQVGFSNISNIYALEKQPDNKILVGGDFKTLHNDSITAICRLNPNGEQDTTFNCSISTTVNGYPYATPKVNKILLLPNGQLIIAGLFNIGNCSNLAKLNSDGSIDTTFFYSSVTNGEINSLDTLPTGKFLIGGSFSQCYSETRNGIAILNNNGSLDTTFIPATSSGILVRSLCYRNNGKILVGCETSTAAGFSIIKQLNINGSIDSSYSLGTTSIGNFVKKIEQLTDSTYLIAGKFTYNPYLINGIMIINPDGGTIPSFNSYSVYSGSQSRTVHDFIIKNDGSIIIAEKSNYYRVLQLNPNGSEIGVNFNIQVGTSSNSAVYTLAELSDTTFIAGGHLNIGDGDYRNGVFKSNMAGINDPHFMMYYGASSGIRSFQKLSNGQLMLCGDFNVYNGYFSPKFVRINEDGTIDSTFISTINIATTIEIYAVQSTGKLVIKSGSSLRRYNTNGSMDTTFAVTLSNPNSSFKLLIDSVDNLYYPSTNSIIKLNPDGNVISSYISPDISGFENAKILSSGKMLIIGILSQQTSNIIRLNTDGTIDNSFVLDPNLTVGGTTSGYAGYDYSIYEESDGSILIGNVYFQLFPYSNPVNAPLFRLDTNGAFDLQFLPSYPVTKVLDFLSDNTIIVLYQDNTTSSFNIGFLKNNGEIDYRFTPKKVNFINSPISLLNHNDDQLIITGALSAYDNQPVHNICRITNCFGPVKYDHITAYSQYTWINGINYTSPVTGPIVSFPVQGSCDSLIILDLNIILPEVNVFTTNSSSNSCTGTCQVTMSGLGGPYLFTVDNTVLGPFSNTCTFTNLCAGVYNVVVTDFYTNQVYNSTCVIAEDSNYYLSNPFNNNSVIDDSLGYVVENCDIDFNTIYDFYIDSVYPGNQDSVMVIWAIVDSISTTYIEAAYLLPDSGNYYLQLQIFCISNQEKSLPHRLVFTEGVNYKNGQISTLGLEEQKIELFSFYPNPADDHIKIHFSGSNGILNIFDATGKLILSDQIINNEKVNIEKLESGTYIIEVLFNETKKSSVLIKK